MRARARCGAARRTTTARRSWSTTDATCRRAGPAMRTCSPSASRRVSPHRTAKAATATASWTGSPRAELDGDLVAFESRVALDALGVGQRRLVGPARVLD